MNTIHHPKILLLSPRGPLYRHKTGIWKKSLRYMPLTLPTLAALTPAELNADLRLIDESVDEIDLEADADLVGISAITGTSLRAYEIAAHFRKRGIPVVLGGVHPTLVPEEAARHADAVVTGYAEESWPELLRDWQTGNLKSRYHQRPGLSLANFPQPRRELLDGGAFTAMHTIEATRGCIHHCEFCVVPSAWGKPIQRPVGEVVAELRNVKAKRLIFLDLNLIADIPYAKELFTALIPLKLKWGGLATTLIARDPELLELAAKSGCKGLLIGFETLSSESLKEAHKAFNLKQDYYEVMHQLHAHDIAVMGTFVFGFDSDTKHTIQEVVDFVQSTHIDLPRYAIQTPFPGTPLYHRLKAEGRIITEDWTLYDGQHAVYHPKKMSASELLTYTHQAWQDTYSYRSIMHRLAGARKLLSIAVPANLGYRFYANNLHRFYNCEWVEGVRLVA